MARVLLDTDTLSDFLRGREDVVQRFHDHFNRHGAIGLCTITIFEIIRGQKKRK